MIPSRFSMILTIKMSGSQTQKKCFPDRLNVSLNKVDENILRSETIKANLVPGC